MDEAQELLTVEEVADLLRISPRTVRRLSDSGELPFAKVGRQWRIRRAAVDAYLDATTKASEPHEATPA